MLYSPYLCVCTCFTQPAARCHLASLFYGQHSMFHKSNRAPSGRLGNMHIDYTLAIYSLLIHTPWAWQHTHTFLWVTMGIVCSELAGPDCRPFLSPRERRIWEEGKEQRTCGGGKVWRRCMTASPGVWDPHAFELASAHIHGCADDNSI